MVAEIYELSVQDQGEAICAPPYCSVRLCDLSLSTRSWNNNRQAPNNSKRHIEFQGMLKAFCAFIRYAGRLIKASGCDMRSVERTMAFNACGFEDDATDIAEKAGFLLAKAGVLLAQNHVT